MISTRLWENFSMIDSIQISGFTCRRRRIERCAKGSRQTNAYTLTHVGVDAVGHEFGLPIRGNEGDRAVALEARKADTLVELHVLHHHRLSFVT